MIVFLCKGGGSSIPEYLQNSIYSFLKENSTVASNRMVRNKSDTWLNRGAYVTARYLHDSKSNLFDKFPFKNDLSKYCFVKYANISSRY